MMKIRKLGLHEKLSNYKEVPVILCIEQNLFGNCLEISKFYVIGNASMPL